MTVWDFSDRYHHLNRGYPGAARVMQGSISKCGSCSVFIGRCTLLIAKVVHTGIFISQRISSHHAGPKIGVGRFQLGFFRVLYLQKAVLSDILTQGMGPIRHGKGFEAA